MTAKRRLAVLTSLLLLAAGCASSAAQPATGGLTSIGAGLSGPAGYVATVYATGVANVAALATDRQQRLWVAAAAFSDSGADAVYLVSAAGATPQKVLSDVHTPLGLLWLDDTLFVGSAERVDAYAGFDGTAFATHRTVLTLPAGVGETNGLALGPDGRLRLGISAPCDHCVPTSEYSGAVVSFRPDGTDLRVDAGGIRAPVGLTFRPDTGELFVTMNQRDDL
ncbi:MAG TPA: hypothetical protein VEN99_08830, partial [Acidimicrobiia bacterium]|nr:hypothetical protein [Acidimicrobiia bacterium]